MASTHQTCCCGGGGGGGGGGCPPCYLVTVYIEGVGEVAITCNDTGFGVNWTGNNGDVYVFISPSPWTISAQIGSGNPDPATIVGIWGSIVEPPNCPPVGEENYTLADGDPPFTSSLVSIVECP